jgi:rRNA pseudouridine-1189 N-methylase Emg1 (Nep1/Mra1 family)
MKPVSINKSTYLRVPRDFEELLGLMTARVCTVDFKIDEKGCSLVYNFAKPIPDLIEEPGPRQPLWLEKELLA